MLEVEILTLKIDYKFKGKKEITKIRRNKGKIRLRRSTYPMSHEFSYN